MPSLDRLRDKLKCPACLDGRKPWKAPHPPNSIGTLGLERFISESRCYVRGTKRPPPELGRILRASIISSPRPGKGLGAAIGKLVVTRCRKVLRIVYNRKRPERGLKGP